MRPPNQNDPMLSEEEEQLLDQVWDTIQFDDEVEGTKGKFDEGKHPRDESGQFGKPLSPEEIEQLKKPQPKPEKKPEKK